MTYFIGDNSVFKHLSYFASDAVLKKIHINIKRPADFNDLNKVNRIIIQLELQDRDVGFVIPLLKFFINQTVSISLTGFLPRECCFNEIRLPVDQLFYIQLPASRETMNLFMNYEAINFEPSAWVNCRNSFSNRMSHIIRSFSKNDQKRYLEKLNKMLITF